MSVEGRLGRERRAQERAMSGGTTRRKDPGGNSGLGSFEPHGGDFGFAEARHLLWRAGFGGSAAQVALIAGWGLERAVEHLVGYGGVEAGTRPAEVRGDIKRERTAEERRAERAARQSRDEESLARIRLTIQQRERDDRRQMSQVQRWWLARMIETARPLEEKLTLLWHGHFATSYRTIENSYHMLRQNEMFRSHAAGNFGQMLFAIIRDPAMLAYLNNNQSRRDRPNENLARELMELFSLGVGNYSERDIKEGARALTGYTFVGNEFAFQASNHDPNPKRVLGKAVSDGDDFVKAILAKRECAEFVCAKLYRYFVGDYPSGVAQADEAAAGVIKEMSRELLRARYELRPVLRRLFLSGHFYSARVRGSQIKSPTQLVVGAVRSLNTPARDLDVLSDAMDRMGQELFYPPSVKGWDGGRSWINTATLYARQNAMVYLISGKRPVGRDALADAEPFRPEELVKAAEALGMSEGDAVAALLMVMIGRADINERGDLEEFARRRSGGGRVDHATLVELAMLIAALPRYQLC
ncbi:MAG: hypothetical protein C0475_06470 [Planctomyces sp.]|nr:hypothetical protein [Planctomyces sp.]